MAETFPQRQVVAAGRPAEGLGARIAAVPVSAWLTAIVVLSFGLHVALALFVPAPWIFADELSYSELAKSFAATGHFAVRDVPGLGLGPVYPVLIAPAYALFGNAEHAWVAAKLVNAFLVSLAALPTYALGRRLLTPGWALVAAGLAVLVPSTVYVSTITTESLFYPLFLLVALAIVRALERPSAGRQLAALAAIGLACLTRTQAVALLAAYPTAVAAGALGYGWRGSGRRIARYWPSAAALAGAVLSLAAWESAHGRTLFAVLGDAQGVESRSYAVGDVARWFLYHLAELDLYVGVLPFAALLVLVGRALARRDRELWVFTATAISLAFWLLLTVAVFVSGLSKYDPHTRTHVFDRYTFYLAPLLLIALCVWASRRVTASTRTTAVAAVVAGALTVLLPYSTLIRDDTVPDAVGLLPWVVNDQGAVVARPGVIGFVVVLAFALSALFFLLRRGTMPYVPPFMAFLWLVTTLLIAARWYNLEGTAARASGPDRVWVDQALPHGARAVAIWSSVAGPHLIWETEFFNRNVGDVYYLREPTWEGLPEQKLTVTRSGVLVDAAHKPLRVRYALVDPWVILRGRIVARDRVSGMRLYRLDDRPARIGSL